MKIWKNLLLIAFGVLVMVSCKKDDDDATRTENLCDKDWQLKAMTVNPPLFGFTDLYALLDDCEKDNFTRYSTNGTMLNDEGPTKCDPGDPQTISGIWNFSNNENVLNMIIDGDTTSLNIDELSGSVLKGYYSDTLDLGTGPVVYTTTLTFNKL